MVSQEESEKVRYISLVRKAGGEPILGIPYRSMSVDPDLVASFVLAIIIFENRDLKTFTKEGYVVVIEEGKHVVGLLIVDKVEDDEPYRRNLKRIIAEFEEKYNDLLNNWKGDIRPFREYALDILSIYPYSDIDFELVPRLLKRSKATPDQKVKIPWSVGKTDEKVQEILGFINGKRSILEIMEASKYDQNEIGAIFSMLYRYKWISLSRKLESDSKIVKVSDPPRFLIGVYGNQLEHIVELCDGTRSLSDICDELPYSMEVVKTLAKNLIDAGVLKINGTK